MTPDTITQSQRTAAKVAGLSFLFTMVIVVFANYGLLNPLIVPGNAAETARNILAHETQFRVVVVGFLAYSMGVFVLLTALYVILKPVNAGLALAGAIFRFVFALLWLLTTLNLLGSLRLLGTADYLQAFEPERYRRCRGSICPETLMTIMSVSLSFRWPPRSAVTCSLSRSIFPKDWLSLE